MRIAVIGAGAVGGALAARLAGSGHDVEVTARGAHLAAIRAGGIRLRGAWGSMDVAVTANEVLAQRPDLAIVTTKAQDAETALRANAGQLEHVPVLIVQNGLEGIATGRRVLPASTVSGGLALFAASYLSPGEVTITAAGATFVGGDGAAALAAALPELDLTVVDDFAGAQWTKLIINQVNALPAATGLSVQEVIADRSLRTVLVAGMQEATRIGMTRVVRFGALQGLTDAKLRLFARAPRWIAAAIPLSLARRMGATPNPGSTLQSIRRGQPSEIDYLNGAVVRAASEAGGSAPVNAAIVELVHEVERTGRFFTPAEVVARVPRE